MITELIRLELFVFGALHKDMKHPFWSPGHKEVTVRCVHGDPSLITDLVPNPLSKRGRVTLTVAGTLDSQVSYFIDSTDADRAEACQTSSSGLDSVPHYAHLENQNVTRTKWCVRLVGRRKELRFSRNQQPQGPQSCETILTLDITHSYTATAFR